MDGDDGREKDEDLHSCIIVVRLNWDVHSDVCGALCTVKAISGRWSGGGCGGGFL